MTETLPTHLPHASQEHKTSQTTHMRVFPISPVWKHYQGYWAYQQQG